MICLYLGRKLVRARGHVMKFFVTFTRIGPVLDDRKAFHGVDTCWSALRESGDGCLHYGQASGDAI